jgi:hypothetical protein
MQLLLGCGTRRNKLLWEDRKAEWRDLVTVDIDASCKPDQVWDLDKTPWPFRDNSADEIHAYEVLEHLGQQGDLASFFGTFGEIWRILQPNGKLFATVPKWNSPWAWGDPGHRRVITEGSLVFLDQSQYERQVGFNAMADYRGIWKGNLQMIHSAEKGESLWFVLRAVKGPAGG